MLREAPEPESHRALVLLQDVDPLEKEEQQYETGDEKTGKDL
jgi:hypothetical protein